MKIRETRQLPSRLCPRPWKTGGSFATPRAKSAGSCHAAWMFDVPDEVAQYAEGQRIVAAYLLRKVDDPDSNFPRQGRRPNM